MSQEFAARFFALFSGLAKGHGEYVLDGTTDTNGKKNGEGVMRHYPLTIERVEQHLAGDIHIGTCPIREDAMARFGAIDVDAYIDFDLFKLAEQIAALNLPLVVCRTKSGGAHLYLFTKEDISAELVRGKLMEWAVALGYAGVEVFPKQTRLAGPNDYGNWINLPYQQSEMTDRYAVLPNKVELSLEQFLDYAENIAVTKEQLTAIEPPQNKAFEGAFEGGPPCLQTLAVRGFEKGSRNNALFNICVLLRKQHGDEGWQEHVDAMNHRFIDPPLGHKEVQAVIKSASKKSYMYRCNDTPIASVCNRQICLTRKFGVGGQGNDPGVDFGNLVKLQTEPPIWFWSVNGKRIELSTQELKDQARFHTRAIEELNEWPKHIKGDEWAKIIRDRLERVEIVEVPPEARQEGMIWSALERFLVNRPAAKSKDELLRDLPWTDPDGFTHFRIPAFQKFLETDRIRVAANRLWTILRDKGARHDQHNIKGRCVQVWIVKKFPTQDSDFEIPRLDEDTDL